MLRRDALSLALRSTVGCVLAPSYRADAAQVAVYPRVLAHFCTWLRKRLGENSWNETTTIPWRSSGVGLGYDSLDPVILRAQCVEMVQHGIVPLASWWGKASPAGDPWLDLWVSEPRPVPAAVLYEGQDDSRTRRDRDGWWHMDDAHNAAVLRAELAHLEDKYFSKFPNHFLKVDGRSFVLLWPLHAWQGDLRAVLQGLPARDRLFLVGTSIDGFRLPDVSQLPVLSGLDGVTAYNIYDQSITQENGGMFTPALVQRYRFTLLTWQEWLAANLPKAKLILPLTLAFNDSKVPGRHNPPFAATSESAIAVMAEMFQIAGHFHAHCGNVMGDLMSIASWNEHFEGTAIEPNTPWGDLWLRLVHEHLTSRPLPDRICV